MLSPSTCPQHALYVVVISSIDYRHSMLDVYLFIFIPLFICSVDLYLYIYFHTSITDDDEMNENLRKKVTGIYRLIERLR